MVQYVRLKRRNHQVSVALEDRPKTTFAFPGSGLWQFTVLAFGLCNAPTVFERLMLKMLAGLTWKTCLVYLDDIIVFAKTFEEQFFQKRVAYLEHVVSEAGVSTDPENTKTVSE